MIQQVDLDWVPEIADEAVDLIKWLIVVQWAKTLTILGVVVAYFALKAWGSRRAGR